MASQTATIKPPAPPHKRRISHISMQAVQLAPLTEEEAEQITLLMFRGAVAADEGEVQIRTNGVEEEETLFLRHPQGQDVRSPFERAMLLTDPFQSEEGTKTLVSSTFNEAELDLAFAEHYGTLEG